MSGERAAAAVFDLISYDKLGQAEGSLETALQKFPSHYSVQVAQALLLLKTGHYLAAKERALELSRLSNLSDHRATEMLITVLQQTCSWSALATVYERLQETQDYRKVTENLVQTYARAGEYDRVQRLSMELYRKYNDAKYQVWMVQACLAQVPHDDPHHMMMKLATKLLNTAVLTERGICNSCTTTMYFDILRDQGLFHEAVEFICSRRGAKVGLLSTRLELLAQALLLENTASSKRAANAVAKKCWMMQLDNWTPFTLYVESLCLPASCEQIDHNRESNNINTSIVSIDCHDSVHDNKKANKHHYTSTLVLEGESDVETLVIDLNVADSSLHEALTFVRSMQTQVLLNSQTSTALPPTIECKELKEESRSEEEPQKMETECYEEHQEKKQQQEEEKKKKKLETKEHNQSTHYKASQALHKGKLPRGPFLAELTLLQKCAMNTNEDEKNAELDSAVLSYAQRFYDKPCCYLDVSTFLSVSSARAIYDWSQTKYEEENEYFTDSASKEQNILVDNIDGSHNENINGDGDNLVQNSMRALETNKALKSLSSSSPSSSLSSLELLWHMRQILGLRCYVASWWLSESHMTTSDDGSVVKDDKCMNTRICVNEMNDLINKYVHMYNVTKHLSTHLAWSEQGLCDGYLHTAMVIAIHAARNASFNTSLSSWAEKGEIGEKEQECQNDTAEVWYMKGLELLHDADRVVNNPTLLLLSICLARQLGLADLRALRHLAFRSVQHDTMSHVGYNTLLIGCAMEDVSSWNELALRYYTRVEQDCSLLRAKVFNYTSWPAMKDVREFEQRQRHSVMNFATRALHYVTKLLECQTHKSMVQFIHEHGAQMANDYALLEEYDDAQSLVDNTDWNVIYSLMPGNIHSPELQAAMQSLVNAPTLQNWTERTRHLLNSILLVHDIIVVEQHRQDCKEAAKHKHGKSKADKQKKNKKKEQTHSQDKNTNSTENESKLTEANENTSPLSSLLSSLRYYKRCDEQDKKSECYSCEVECSSLSHTENTEKSDLLAENPPSSHCLLPSISTIRLALIRYIQHYLENAGKEECQYNLDSNINEECTKCLTQCVSRLVSADCTTSTLFEEFVFPELVLVILLLRAGPKDALPLQTWAKILQTTLQTAMNYYDTGKWTGMSATFVQEPLSVVSSLRDEKLKRIKTYLHDRIIDIDVISR